MSKAEKTFPVNSIHRLRPLSLYFGRIMFLALRMGNKMNIPISSLLSTPSHADIVLEFLCWRIKLCCLAKGETENNKSIPFYYCYYITHVFLKKFLLWISLLGRVVGGMGSRVFSKWNPGNPAWENPCESFTHNESKLPSWRRVKPAGWADHWGPGLRRELSTLFQPFLGA